MLDKSVSVKERIRQELDKLERDKIHILYFSYYINWHNLYKGPLLLATKLLNFVLRQPSIDHVCHISRFVYDEDEQRYDPKVFEATMERGMEQNDLFEKLKQFQGICYIETLGRVNKIKAKEFEKRYYGIPYSKMAAAMSGIDIEELDEHLKLHKSKGGFCSWLVSLFLKDQNVVSLSNDKNPLDNFLNDKGVAEEITPTDIFLAGLGERRILFKW